MHEKIDFLFAVWLLYYAKNFLILFFLHRHSLVFEAVMLVNVKAPASGFGIGRDLLINSHDLSIKKKQGQRKSIL